MRGEQMACTNMCEAQGNQDMPIGSRATACALLRGL